MNRHREEIYENPWSKLGPVLFTGVLLLGLFMALGALWITWFDAETVPLVYKLIGSTVCLLMLWAIWFYFEGYLETAMHIVISAAAIKGISLYKKERVIRFDDVLTVETARQLEQTVFVMAVDGTCIEFNGYVNSFGHIVETVLDRAENVRVVDIDDLIEKTPKDRKNEGWQKEVNYEIINRAKARAEENRKRLDNQTA